MTGVTTKIQFFHTIGKDGLSLFLQLQSFFPQQLKD